MFFPHEKRARYRAGLHELDRLIANTRDALGEGRALPVALLERLHAVTGTHNVDAFLPALTSFRTALQHQFDSELCAAAPHDFSAFAEFMVPEEPPEPVHLLFCEYLMKVHRGEIKKLLVAVGPNTGKSTWCSIKFAAWVVGVRPDSRLLLCAHNAKFSINRIGKPIRNLIQNPRYQQVFGSDYVVSAESSAADFFSLANTTTGYTKSIGVGGGLSGYRSDLTILDDLYSSYEDAMSATTREKVLNWYKNDVDLRSEPTGATVAVNTRWCQDDLIGVLTDENPDDWVTLSIPALPVDETDPLGRDPANPTTVWPSRITLDFLTEKRRSLTHEMWSALYQCHPLPAGGQIVKSEHLHYYDALPPDSEITDIICSLDAAEKTTKASDNSALTVWAVAKNADKKRRTLFLIRSYTFRYDIVDLIPAIEEVAVRHGAKTMLVEDRGAGTQILQIRAKSPKPGLNYIGIPTNQKSKEWRLRSALVDINAGFVKLPRETDGVWMDEYLKELLSFDGSGKGRDDQVDSTSMAVLHYRNSSGGRRGVTKLNKKKR